MMRAFQRVALLGACLGLGAGARAEVQALVLLGRGTTVQANGLPSGWKPLGFRRVPRRTRYSLRSDGEDRFVLAESSGSASAILREVEADVRELPLLAWRWKVERSLRSADARRKSGDDFAARIYVAFRYDPASATAWERLKYGILNRFYGAYPPKASLNYVWDNRLPVGASIASAYTDRVRLIVLESGDAKAGGWVAEERNVREDFVRAFGAEPPPLSFVALMTDTDNTGESAVAGYADVVLRRPRAD